MRQLEEDLDVAEDSSVESRFSILIDLCLLARELLDLTTANDTIDQIARVSDLAKKVPVEHHMTKVYEFTTSGDPLRSLMRDYYVKSTARIMIIIWTARVLKTSTRTLQSNSGV